VQDDEGKRNNHSLGPTRRRGRKRASKYTVISVDENGKKIGEEVYITHSMGRGGKKLKRIGESVPYDSPRGKSSGNHPE